MSALSGEASTTCITAFPFVLSTGPWAYSNVMRELVMHWRRGSIRVLPYLDDFMLMERGFWQWVRFARRAEKDRFLAGLKINVPKCHTIPA